MKFTTILLAVLPLVAAGGGPKDPDSLPRIPLPLHELAECWQECLQLENNHYPPNINNVNVHDFCVDNGYHLRWWSFHTLATCTAGKCNREEGIQSQKWLFDLCKMN
ncbi:hypothetical protein CTAM01_12968 [Colletotrichum tamarilloi]|uniref:Uncharacterized protein n=1 Tax=Colletotrichum tamarilloi TaxID=1209934 RepID=A0ABQ9QTJ5_9PEZI|nr:uncharacterized protein CTAM01_12968 [Colletotrichum tamarilloi]KAI3536724.1 hypothetical protein CSPX01_10621 [Colletotrichum filicis]KAK1484597.1 hypothetical protein CTAM01_12968 [Colletotrichum tamarilloi]